MTSNNVTALNSMIRRASRSVEFQWPGVIGRDDVEQSIYLRLLESPGSVEAILEMDDPARYRAIVGIGHQIASQERADYDYYKGSYRYGVPEVKYLLRLGVLGHPIDGFHDSQFDLTESFWKLAKRTPAYAEALLMRYADNEIPQIKSQQNALHNGLCALVDEMNKHHRSRVMERDDGLGSRRVMSNAEAQMISARQYSGDNEGGY